MLPGTAKTSLPCSAATSAVMRAPLASPASTTTRTMANPDTIRLRTGKLPASGRVPSGYSVRMAPCAAVGGRPPCAAGRGGMSSGPVQAAPAVEHDGRRGDLEEMGRVGRVLPRQDFETAARQALDLPFEIQRAARPDDPGHGMRTETASAQRRFIGTPGRGDVAEMVEQQSQANRADSCGAAESNPVLGRRFHFHAIFDRAFTAGRTAEITTALFVVSSQRSPAKSDRSRNT